MRLTTTSVLLVQGNVQQSLKWRADQQWPNILRYLDLTRPQYQHDIIVWPESAITALEPYADDVLYNIDQAASVNGAGLVTGIIDYQQLNDDFYNSVIVLGQEHAEQALEQPYQYGHSNRYQKHQLLPIGEYVPFESLLRPLAPLFNLPMSSFSRGAYQQPNLMANGHQLNTAICYEIAFSEQVRDNTHAGTDYLLTISNDTWFGDSHGPWQHMQIAQMRAKELGRPLLRATNNGVSAVTDEFGRILAMAPQFTATTVSAEVPQVSGQTLFARLGHTAVCCLPSSDFCLCSSARNRRGQHHKISTINTVFIFTGIYIMENILDALLFAVLVAAGGLGLSSWLMFFIPADVNDREAVQRQRFENIFFGLAGIVIMLVMWYAIS